MNSEERIICALKREEVDRVPTFEWLISDSVIQALHPGDSLDDFVYHMDLDAVCPDLDYECERVDEDTVRDEWGIIKRYTAEEHSLPVSGPIRTMSDLSRYIPPDSNKPSRYRTLEGKIERHKGEKAVIPHLNDVLSIPSRLMGFEEFMMAVSDEPALVEGLIELTVEVNLEMAKQAVKRGVKIIYTGDDYAYNSGPMMSPQTFEKLFAPWLKKVMRGYKDLGLFVIKHCDGNILPILDIMVDSGIDCLDPVDPVAGMELAHIKKKYGSRIAIKGNVDCADTLTFRSVEDTVEETKRCLRTAAPGYGYILSSSNSIHSKVKPENFRAMVETVHSFGKYPIEV